MREMGRARYNGLVAAIIACPYGVRRSVALLLNQQWHLSPFPRVGGRPWSPKRRGAGGPGGRGVNLSTQPKPPPRNAKHARFAPAPLSACRLQPRRTLTTRDLAGPAHPAL